MLIGLPARPGNQPDKLVQEFARAGATSVRNVAEIPASIRWRDGRWKIGVPRSVSPEIMQPRTAIQTAAVLVVTALHAAGQLWTDPEDPKLPADFRIQGEYVGEINGGGKLGAQVIALGDGEFQAVVYPGGLPGAGWNGTDKMLMDGVLRGEQASFKPAQGKKSYMAESGAEFSATTPFPPEGHQPYSGLAAGGELGGTTHDGKSYVMKRTIRKSPSMGAEPPEGAIVLFDGTKESMAHWNGGRLDEKTGLLNTDGNDITTKEKFQNYTMHLEFLLPFKPDARSQGRGNSGFYQADLYEMQILDSFGLMGLNNECGGIYQKADPLVNMCLPPLQWQTYDVEFASAAVDDDGKKSRNAVLTAELNGVKIHDGLEIDGKTGGARDEPEGTPGPIRLQGHGNPLQFRNVWIVPKG